MKKPKSVHTQIFGKKNALSFSARSLFVFLAGVDSLLKKLPPVEQLPRICATPSEELLIELSDKGYVLGTAKKYSLNYKKLKANFSTKIDEEKEPKVLDIIREFQKQHRAQRKSRAFSGERDMIQIRFLIRNYNGHEVKKQIIPYLTDKNTPKIGELGIAQFFKYALFRLQKQFGKPSEVPAELGVSHKKK